MKLAFIAPLYLVLIFCFAPSVKAQTTQPTYQVKEDSMLLWDKTRNRSIPVEIYLPNTTQIKHPQLVIISHGYNNNREGTYKYYSSIANCLAAHGYFVASIQHELETDSLVPSIGKPYVVRMSNWVRGTENILFVINDLKKTHKQLDYKHVTLIGHSNGGDMSMLFAHKYPDMIDKVISLDNRRMPMPVVKHPHIYSLRSSDQPADEGVIPSPELQKHMGITIVKLPNTIHNDMADNATEAQRKEINNYLLTFLNDETNN
ncbi:alpha/beta hydrolase [Flavipsychrobacter stenotrophus]|uniref:Alpha/beta hydrolase n=1 Tax=Flavipsychrobacter stenotrophus TaxID=2077091 RepID=A0A2S7STE9_9BACT|nr:alpha/beta fold hydrolase [Flavipsychrobacter stenotrophus]PQJ09901.1 alpha/beta hydrolase [Flavipsychrobacter stenotrophus]